MLASLFSVLFGDTILALLIGLSGSLRQSAVNAPIDPVASALIKNVDFMFPEEFLHRYPHGANADKLEIFTYLIFNLLVKGYGSVDPEKVWSNYNRDDYNRVLIDAVFYEYLSDFKDSQNKDLLVNLSKNDIPASREEIAVNRIGQYLDHLSETEPRPKRFKGSKALSELQIAECNEMQTLFESTGTPGIDYPNFCDIPETSFSCVGKRIPGIYADFQTGCQVFHVCWPHRIDSFLCPIGTIFNQSLLTCDVWHATGCYSSPLFFERDQFLIDDVSTEHDVPEFDGSCETLLNQPLRLHIKFLPAKCEVRNKEESKHVEKLAHEKYITDIQMRMETAYDLVREMLHMLREIRRDLAAEMKNRGTPWIHILERRKYGPKYGPTQSPETMNDTTEFSRKLGETDFESSMTTEDVDHSGKLSSGTKPDLTVTRSALLEPSESLDLNIESIRKQDVPEIVIGSLRLGGNILNEGIPLTKQVIIDSYRKIKSKKP